MKSKKYWLGSVGLILLFSWVIFSQEGIEAIPKTGWMKIEIGKFYQPLSKPIPKIVKVQVVQIGNCEYILGVGETGSFEASPIALTHRGDCPNPIHKR